MILEIQEQTGASIRKVCEVLKVPRSGFYHAANPSNKQLSDKELTEKIAIIFGQHRKRYGHRRICEQLREEGLRCAPRRVRRLMKKAGLRAIQPKCFVPKTSDGKASKPAPNLLINRVFPSRANEVWTADITYIPTLNGWLYLAIVMDLCSRKILGWKLADHMRTELVLEAFQQAFSSTSIKKADCPIFHSDRGSQYGSHALRTTLKDAGFCQSMSARSNPYDNAWTESFFGTMKREMLQKGVFENFADANTEIFEYIEGYYNRKRKHSALGYRTPAQFERNLSLQIALPK
jgi:transposase InsO family protein